KAGQGLRRAVRCRGRRLPDRHLCWQIRRAAHAARRVVQRAGVSAFHAGVLRRSALRRQSRQGVLEADRLSRLAGVPHEEHRRVPRQALPRRGRSQIDSGFQLERTSAMATKLPKKAIVFVGGGLTAGLAARQLTAKGIEVLVLERGGDHRGAAENRLPSQRDELRWGIHNKLVQDWAVETYSLRHSPRDASLPVRRMEAFLPGQGLGGAADHWNGQTW